MARYVLILVSVGLLVVFVGCYSASEPLVVIGGGEDTHKSDTVRDPAPGVPDSDLTHPQRLQRELAICQENLKGRDRKIDRLEDQIDGIQDTHKDEVKRYEKKINSLEDRVQELEKENRALRRKCGD